jgi:hypothetical protein
LVLCGLRACFAPDMVERLWSVAAKVADRERVVPIEHLQAGAALLRDGLCILGAQPC